MGFFLHFGKKLLKRGGERAPNGGGTSFGNPEPLAERRGFVGWLKNMFVCLKNFSPHECA